MADILKKVENGDTKYRRIVLYCSQNPVFLNREHSLRQTEAHQEVIYYEMSVLRSS